MSLFDATEFDAEPTPPAAPAVAAGAALQPQGSSLLDLLFSVGLIGVAGRRFAMQVAATESPAMQALAALTVQAVIDGNSCVLIDGLAERLLVELQAGGADEAALASVPDESTWREALSTTNLVARLDVDPDDPGKPQHDELLWRPLVIDDDRVFLRRFFLDEQAIANRLLGRIDSSPLAVDESIINGLFPPTDRDPGNGPLQACKQALASRLTVLTGGPGTGKTWTLARIISALWTADRQLDIALAAPTGKAAMRMREAVATSAESLDDALAARVGQVDAATLHRLLGLRPGRDPRRHSQNRLPHDVVIVDEASMISLPLMADLLRALRDDARLILVGDPRQLASVEAGAVLDDLVQAPVLASHIAELDVNHRSIEAFDELFAAVNRGEAERAIELLRSPDTAVEWIDTANCASTSDELAMTNELVQQVLAPHAHRLIDAARADELDQQLCRGLLDEVKVLSATRSGVMGVDTWGRRIETELFGRVRPALWYPGRPLLVTENNYITGLLNGDTGICLGADAWFPGTGRFATQQLGEISTWWAMTIHKSQGSEFEHAIVSLGEQTRIHSRELLYTGLTRARSKLTVIASEPVLRATIARRSTRASGLVAKLASAKS